MMVAIPLQLAAAPAFGADGAVSMSDWMPVSEWRRCGELARPGVTFEIRNAAGQSLFSPCTADLPESPWDWTSPPKEFRAVPETPPRHSAPIPAPAK